MSAVASKKKKVFDGRYEVLSIVGRGSASVVYHARHAMAPGVEVALKVLLNEKDVRVSGEKLRKEALAMVSSRHKYVIRLDDFHSIGELCYLSMEFAPEADLRKYVTSKLGGKLPAAQGEQYLLQMAEALAFIHRAGITHRDVKPDNMLVINAKEVRLGDFGLAVLPGEVASTEELQRGVGTMSYMPPEVLEGTGYDSRSDLYALGLSFYEMLAGKHPFEGAPFAEQLEIRRDGNFPHLLKVAPQTPPHLANAIMQALSFDPAKRFPNVREFAQAIMVNRSGGAIPDSKVEAKPAQPVESPKPAAAITPFTPPSKATAPVAPPQTTPPPAQSAPSAPVNVVAQESPKVVEMKREPEAEAPKKADAPKTYSPPPKEAVESKPAQPAQKEVAKSEVKPAPKSGGSLASRAFIETQAQGSNDPSEAFSIAGVEPPPQTGKGGALQSSAQPKGKPPVRDSKLDKGRENNKRANRDIDLSSKKTMLVDKETVGKVREEVASKAQRSTNSANTFVKNPRLFLTTVMIVIPVMVLWTILYPPVRRRVLSWASSTFITPVNIEQGNEMPVPSYSGGDLTFPLLPAGVYSGSIRGIIPEHAAPLTILSFADQKKLVIIVGLEGWAPAVVSLAEYERADSASSQVLKVKSNGFILRMAGQNTDGTINGYFKNGVTGETGEWQVAPVKQ